MDETINKIARALMKLRRCDEEDGAAEDGFPCPFCHWPLDADEESGCFAWAEEIAKALGS